eukprot:3768598-Amphidinium_carterae.1
MPSTLSNAEINKAETRFRPKAILDNKPRPPQTADERQQQRPRDRGPCGTLPPCPRAKGP